MDPTRRAMLNEFGLVQHAVLQSPQHNTVHVIYGHTNKHFVHSQLTEELKTRTGLQLVPPQSGGAMAPSPAESVLIVIVDCDDSVTDRLLRQAVEASGHPDTRTLFIQMEEGGRPDWVNENLPRSTLLLYPDVNRDSRLYGRNTSIPESTSSLAFSEEERKAFWDDLSTMIGDPDMDPTRRAMLNEFGLVQHAVLQSPQHNTVHVIYGHTNRHFVHSQLTEELKTRTGLQLVPPQSGGAMAPSPADSVLIVIVDVYDSNLLSFSSYMFDKGTDRLLRQAVEASGHPDTRTLFIQKEEGGRPDWVNEKLSRSTLLSCPEINRDSWLYGRNISIPDSTSSPALFEDERKAFWDNLAIMIGKLSQKRSSVQPSKRMLTSSVDGHHKSEPTSTPLYEHKPGSASTCEEDCRTDHTLAPTEDLKLEHPDMNVTEDGTKADYDRTSSSQSEQHDFQCCYCSCDSLSSSSNSSDGESGSEASSNDSATESKECHQYSLSGSGGSPECVDLDLPSPDVSLPADKPVPDLPSPERVDLDLPSPERVDLDLPSPERVDLDLPSPVCSPAWQASSLFTRHGGCLRKPGSDVILHVPPGAVNSDSGVVIRAAVCADVARIRHTLRLPDDEQVVSPLAEFWAGHNYTFQRPVTVTVPHCLPTDFDLDGVRVYHVARSGDSTVAIRQLERHSDEQKETAPLSDLDTNTEEKDCFSLEGDHIKVFTNHFSGFTCTYCAKKGKSKYRPELYVTGSGSVVIEPDPSPAQVDVFVHVWDKRLTLADFRQEYGFEAGPVKNVELLPNFKQSQLELRMRPKDRLMYRLDVDGHLLHPGETKTFDLMPYFGCEKCAAAGRQLPMSHQWAMETPPGTRPVTAMEVSIDVLNLPNETQGTHPAQTTLILKVKPDSTRQQRSTTTQTSASQQRSSTTQTNTEDCDNTLVKHLAINGCAGQSDDFTQLNSADASFLQRNVSNGDAVGDTHQCVPANGSTASQPARNAEPLLQHHLVAKRQHPTSDTTRGRLVPAASGGQLDSLLGARFKHCSITINANNNTHNNNVNKLGKMNTGNVSHYNAHSEVEAMDYPTPQSHQPGDIPMVEMPGDTSLQESQQEIEDPED